ASVKPASEETSTRTSRHWQLNAWPSSQPGRKRPGQAAVAGHAEPPGPAMSGRAVSAAGSRPEVTLRQPFEGEGDALHRWSPRGPSNCTKWSGGDANAALSWAAVVVNMNSGARRCRTLV